MGFIAEAILISIGLNLFLFLPAYFFQSDKLTDLSYAITFIVLALFGFSASEKGSIDLIALIMVFVWAARLGGFLFIRILKEGRDSRFDEMRRSWFSFLRFWFFQGLTVFIIILPGLLVWQKSTANNNFVYLGVLVWSVGLLIESVADYQKYKFKLSGARKWIDTGLWRASRHPNYFGEITVWVGFFIVCASALRGVSIVIALASPLYITLILLKFSGVPLLEESADKKWGGDKDYQQYKTEVPVLVPNLSSIDRLLRS